MDRDSNFSYGFPAILKDAGVEPVRAEFKNKMIWTSDFVFELAVGRNMQLKTFLCLDFYDAKSSFQLFGWTGYFFPE